ncbi:unnamed protein product [Triticum turgidum subsp. durum]|uniref:Uncharacterized protein n=1 Tax=Triticum turgidum subsp. durum TaxID=4567 RepID=A0A9R0SRB8_TRITD|nr:unnamed protein product [Triticum turgidum subsp. durum]
MGSDDSGRGSIAFFGTYRPPVPLDIYSCPADPPPSSREDEHHLTDGVSYNQNGRAIPAAALKELLTFLGKKNPALAAECGATPDDAEQGRVAGLVFVSERDKGLETLHVALVRPKGEGGAVKVLSLGDVYGAGTFGGSRMEDSGCVAGGFKVGARAVGHSLVYVSTKEPVTRRRTPWTVVYRTNLADGKTERLTPPGQYDNNLSAPNKSFDKMHSPHTDVGLFRVSGVFPTISKDGAKLAFVDNEFKAVWLADTQGLRVVYEKRGSNSVFSTAWNQNPDKDTLYVCVGPSFSAAKPLEIYAISNVSGPSAGRKVQRLTAGNFNNAFPSSNAQGDKFVFRSTRDGGKDKFHKNLYIMEDAEEGEFGQGTVTRLTDGPWTDTHCSWSPKGDWVVFSSTREMPASAPGMAFLDAGYFAVYLVKVSDPTVVVRVVQSSATLAGHVNHPIFSPDMRSIVFASDLAAVSNEPISMPVFLHSVRPYGDILSVDLRDTDDITKNKDIQEFHRITHSRYEYSTPTWTKFATDDPNEQWNMLAAKGSTPFRPACPYMYPDGGEGWHMAGHLTIPKRCC